MLPDKIKLSYRRATINDIELLTDFRIQFLAEVQGIKSKPVEAELRKALNDYFTRSVKEDSYVSWIASYDNIPVGIGGMAIHEQPGHYHMINGRCGYILNMFTLEEFRKKGICSRILTYLIEEGKQKNLERLDLRATHDGEPVYRKIGFTEPKDKTMDFYI